ncbi:gliomedin-like [Gadus chalcogrammus]|uniref:gliomedin-like n=1 Tax=Gadus chalcogrammus TaxID=1042646 RepID=UPI0024C4A2A8|nr:gliomedin-like [Gadus chalcogrammus]
MKDRQYGVLPWALRGLLLGMAALLLLGSGGLVCLLLGHRDLTQHVARLEARLEAMEGGPRHTDPPEPLHHSRRRRGAEASGGDHQDALMMMTYSRVPLKLFLDLCNSSRGICLTGPPGQPGERGKDGLKGRDGMPGLDGKRGKRGSPGEKGEQGPKGDTGSTGPPCLWGAEGPGAPPSEVGPLQTIQNTTMGARSNQGNVSVGQLVKWVLIQLATDSSSTPRPQEELKVMEHDQTSFDSEGRNHTVAKTDADYGRKHVIKTELPPIYADQGNNSSDWSFTRSYSVTASPAASPGQPSILNRDEGQPTSTTLEYELPPMYADQGKESSDGSFTRSYIVTASPAASPGQPSILNRAEGQPTTTTLEYELPPMYADQGKDSSDGSFTRSYIVTASPAASPGQPIILNRAEGQPTTTTLEYEQTDLNRSNEKLHLDAAGPSNITELPPMYADQGKDSSDGSFTRSYIVTASPAASPGQPIILNRAEGQPTTTTLEYEQTDLNRSNAKLDLDAAGPSKITDSSTTTPGHQKTLKSAEKEEHRAILMEHGGTGDLEASSSSTLAPRSRLSSAEEEENTPMEPVHLPGNNNLTGTEKEITDKTSASSLPGLHQTNDSSKEAGKGTFERTENVLRTITCFENVTQMQSTFGAWVADAAPLREERYWLLDHFSGRIILEYPNLLSYLKSGGRNTLLDKFYQGCGSVVYNGFLYFHNAGTNKLLKFNLETKTTSFLVIENTRHRHRSYLFENSKTYYKFAVDESGLWVMAASATDETLVVAKLNHESFSVTSIIHTRYPKSKAGNGFIAYGILYITDSKDKKITHGFDLERGVSLAVSYALRQANGILAMLSYYPHKQVLYMWDNSSLKTCKVHFAVLKKE